MPAQRQIGGQTKRGLTSKYAVNPARRFPVIYLFKRNSSTSFQHHVYAYAGTIGNMHRHMLPMSLTYHGETGQSLAPKTQVRILQ